MKVWFGSLSRNDNDILTMLTMLTLTVATMHYPIFQLAFFATIASRETTRAEPNANRVAYAALAIICQSYSQSIAVDTCVRQGVIIG